MTELTRIGDSGEIVRFAESDGRTVTIIRHGLGRRWTAEAQYNEQTIQGRGSNIYFAVESMLKIVPAYWIIDVTKAAHEALKQDDLDWEEFDD